MIDPRPTVNAPLWLAADEPQPAAEYLTSALWRWTPMGTTSDRNDPRLRDVGPDGMQAVYLVLSDEERAKGFVRPVRRSYVHDTCGTITTMGQAIAETYARDPAFYGGTYCCGCRAHFPVGPRGEFRWVNEQGIAGKERVGT